MLKIIIYDGLDSYEGSTNVVGIGDEIDAALTDHSLTISYRNQTVMNIDFELKNVESFIGLNHVPISLNSVEYRVNDNQIIINVTSEVIRLYTAYRVYDPFRGGIEVVCYNNSAENIKVDKRADLIEKYRVSGVFREAIDLSSPTVILELDTYPTFNYIHIPSLARYYYVTGITLVNSKLYALNCSCDVLMSFNTEIRAQSDVIIERQEHDFNPSLIDNNLPLSPFRSYEKVSSIHVHGGSLVSPHSTSLFNYVVTVLGEVNAFRSEDPELIGPQVTLPQYGIKSSNVHGQGNRFTNLYGFKDLGFRLFSNKIYNQTFITNVVSFFTGDVASNIKSVKRFPFNVVGSTACSVIAESDAPINVGLVDIELTQGENDNIISDSFAVIHSDTAYLIYSLIVPEADPTDPHRDFLYREPFSNASLYLPYVGYQSLSLVETSGKQIYICYVVSLTSGNAKVYITLRESTDNVRIISSYNCTMGEDVAIGSGPLNDVLKNVVTGVGNIATHVASKSYDRAVTAALDTFKNTKIEMNPATGVSEPNLEDSAVQDPYLLIERPIALEPANYASIYGRPSMKKAALNALQGFTSVKEIHLTNIARATDGERSEIISLLRAGVIL